MFFLVPIIFFIPVISNGQTFLHRLNPVNSPIYSIGVPLGITLVVDSLECSKTKLISDSLDVLEKKGCYYLVRSRKKAVGQFPVYIKSKTDNRIVGTFYLQNEKIANVVDLTIRGINWYESTRVDNNLDSLEVHQRFYDLDTKKDIKLALEVFSMKFELYNAEGALLYHANKVGNRFTKKEKRLFKQMKKGEYFIISDVSFCLIYKGNKEEGYRKGEVISFKK